MIPATKKQIREYNRIFEKVDFEKDIHFRIMHEDLKAIKKILSKDDEKFGNISHFIRCAIRKFIREEKQRLKV